MSNYLSSDEVDAIGFGSIGSNVIISRDARFYGAEHIFLGSHVRIDAYSVTTAGPGNVTVGSYCHVGGHTYISGASGGVTLEYGSGLAPFVAIYSSGEDYTTGVLTNPMVPSQFRNTLVGHVHVGAHAAVGSSSVILPGLRLGFGCSVGALSLVNRDVRAYEVVHGNPIRRVGKRHQATLDDSDAALRATSHADGVRLAPPHR